MSPATGRDRQIRFGRFVLDPANARLYRGDEVVVLRGKTLAVLEYLTARPGELVTKDELLRTLWPEVYVSEDVLVGCVHELRQVLGDTRGTPRYVETVYRRGYRWIAALEGTLPPSDVGRPAPGIVGRDGDLAELQRSFERSAGGIRQVMFVTGEAGIGKTALVDAFVNGLPVGGDGPISAVVARGQCVEQYGPAEPFLPLLDALARLSRQPGCAWAASTLDRCLPLGLLSPVASPPTTLAAGGLMPERAVRLLGGALEALAAERVVVLVLEDMHWSDLSTLDVLSYIAQQPEASRLLVLATYRPTDVILGRHPLRRLEQELRAHARSAQLALGRLAPESVRRWLDGHRPSPPQPFVDWLHWRTEGHPLFLVTLFEALVAAGLVACGDGGWRVEPAYADFGVPESLRLMIDRQVDRLDPADRALLEAASAAGAQFSAAAVAAALEENLVPVERRCSVLAHDGQFVRTAETAEWPDGTVAGGYRFTHELHRHVLYESVSPAHGRMLHQRIGRRLEQAYGARADELAAELAVHFERGRDPGRAIAYLERAATLCTQRGAHREAIATLRRALTTCAHLPDTSERTDRMLFLNLRLGASLLVAEDYADPAVEATFLRCRELAEQAGALPPLLTALAGLHACLAARARLADAVGIVPRMVELTEQLPLPQASLAAHTSGAWARWSRGELADARTHANLAIATQPSEPVPFPSTFDLVGYAFGTSAIVEMALGDLAAARARAHEAVAWSERTARPVDRATALTLAGMLYAFMDDPPAAGERAREAVAVAEEHGFRQWRATGDIVAAWAAASTAPSDRALAEVIRCIDEYTRMGMLAQLSPFLSLAAGAHIGAGRTEVGRELLARAERHARDTGERWYDAEVHRLRGESALAEEPREAEASFRRAIDVARGQGAKLFELRASVGLASLLRRRKRKDAAREVLWPILRTFTADDDAPDLKVARTLYARLR